MREAAKPELPAIESTDWQALAAPLAALVSLAGEAAHRFNNLRAVIDGTLELITAEPAGPLLAKRLERIREAASRAEKLAEGLVTVASLRSGSYRSRIDLAAWLNGARPWLSNLVGEGRGLVLEVPTTSLPFRCDQRELRAVLTALLLNAAQALGPTGTVRVRLEQLHPEDPRAVLLSVTDDGAGMTPEVAHRACVPFFTTRPGAAGLGLTAVEAFARGNGGRLELVSSPGHGTIASLCLTETADSASP